MTSKTSFYVLGIPATQGSKRAFVINGRARMRESSSEKLHTWYTSVRTAAFNEFPAPVAGPVCIRVRFEMPRPKAHYRTGAHADALRIDAPHWCEKKPDLDKLVRAVLDAMTAVVYRDDSQVVEISATMTYAYERSGARIEIEQIEPVRAEKSAGKLLEV